MKVSQQASRASLPGMIRCGLIALCLSAPWSRLVKRPCPVLFRLIPNSLLWRLAYPHTLFLRLLPLQQKNDPDGAYEYAKGQVITLPDAYGDQTLSAQIDRPIDFAAVTDHGQFLVR